MRGWLILTHRVQSIMVGKMAWEECEQLGTLKTQSGTQRGGYSFPIHLLLFIQSRISAPGMVQSMVRMSLPTSVFLI